MKYSVNFNGIELNQYIDVTQDFSPLSGAFWEPTLQGNRGISKGDRFKYTSYQHKVIPMPFTMLDDLQSKYDELQKVLSVTEPKPLIFEGLPQRVFYAVPMSDLEYIEDGPLGEGTITWVIPDGVAHSTAHRSFEAIPVEGGLWETTIVNNGTEDTSVDFNLKIGSDSGFVGIVSEYGTLQYGSIEEVENMTEMFARRTENLVLSGAGQTPVTPPGNWNGWVRDTGINRFGSSNTTQGTLSVQNIAGFNHLHLTARGLATQNVWNGGMHTINIPPDSNGDVGARNFHSYTNHWFRAESFAHTGAQTIVFLTATNQIIMGMSINKGRTCGGTGNCDFVGPNGVLLRRAQFNAMNGAGPYTSPNGHNSFRKEGDVFTFFWWGQWLSFRVPAGLNMVCTRIQVWIGQHGNRNLTNQYLVRNHIRAATFNKLNVERWRDVPNRFESGSEFFVDGNSRDLYVNGMLSTQEENVGSKYFMAPPGETKVQFVTSGFSEITSASARIRERYL
jgi:predicted phage tail component-like protein